MAMWMWLIFGAVVVFMLALDLGVFHRKAHEVSLTEAFTWTVVWIVLSLLFDVVIYFAYEHGFVDTAAGGAHLSGEQAALQYLTGYLLEKSLSLDNIFVIALIFTYFRVPLAFQHRVLFWGVLGAVIMRGIMIGAGVALVQRFDWIMYVFGVLLIITAVKMLISTSDSVEPDKSFVVRMARRFYPVTSQIDGPHFFTRIEGKRAATPLFLALLMVESTDVLFAVDSIPAIFAVTRDPFLIYTSNIFAILGLRSMYFALAAVLDKFRYLKTSLVFMLAFIGVKMLLAHHYPIPTAVSLGVIVGMLAVGILASIVGMKRGVGDLVSPIAQELATPVEAVYRRMRRVIIFVLGVSVVLVGVVMLVLPGPAIVVIPAGLAILATEFVWARALLQRMRNKAGELVAKVQGGAGGEVQE